MSEWPVWLRGRKRGERFTAQALAGTYEGRSYSKKDINADLYKKLQPLDIVRKDDQAPIWTLLMDEKAPALSVASLAAELPEPEAWTNTHVLVDLGNTRVADLRLEDALYRRQRARCRFFADYGKNVRTLPPGLDLWQSDDPSANAAEIRLIWELSRLCEQATPQTIVVVTLDNGFRSIASLARNEGHRLFFARGFDDIASALEPPRG